MSLVIITRRELNHIYSEKGGTVAKALPMNRTEGLLQHLQLPSRLVTITESLTTPLASHHHQELLHTIPTRVVHTFTRKWRHISRCLVGGLSPHHWVTRPHTSYMQGYHSGKKLGHNRFFITVDNPCVRWFKYIGPMPPDACSVISQECGQTVGEKHLRFVHQLILYFHVFSLSNVYNADNENVYSISW